MPVKKKTIATLFMSSPCCPPSAADALVVGVRQMAWTENIVTIMPNHVSEKPMSVKRRAN